jgi:sialate O-acetylesterase
MKHPLTLFVRAAALAALSSVLVCGAVTLPALLIDHMVIQRDLPVHVWGQAAPSEAVAVTFRGNTRSTVADEVGLWSVYLPPSPAGGPFELTVKGENTITLRDVLVGEVWVASGQSNMEMELRSVKDAPAEVAAATHPKIRLFQVKKGTSQYPKLDVDAEPWRLCSPESTAQFSAVAYFLGVRLQEKLNVPIGLIHASWGGTPVESWMSLRSLTSDAAFTPTLALWSKTMDDFAVHQLKRAKQLKDWEAASARAKVEGKTPPSYPWEANIDNSWMPSGTYNAMIAPLTRFPIRGAIWYQGESNAGPERASSYGAMFQAMIRDWRETWGVGDFPFLFVQLANWKAGPTNRWAEVREAQLQTLGLARTGMAVAIDIGDPSDIHPKNKQEVGRRLALTARAIAYGDTAEYSGPLFRNAVAEGSAVRVWFTHGAGLQAKDGELKGFEIAGADGKFAPAVARVDGDSVVVKSADVRSPAHIRYAWADNPECNLYNSDGLPASPFRWSSR